MRKQKVLALLLAGTLVMSNFSTVNIQAATVETQPTVTEKTDVQAESEKLPETEEKEEIQNKEDENLPAEQPVENESTEEELSVETPSIEERPSVETPSAEEKPSTEKQEIYATEEWVKIPDQTFREWLQNVKGLIPNENGDFKKSDMEKIDELSFYSSLPTNLAGIEYAVNLKSLIIQNDIKSEQLNKYISQLKSLERLTISNAKITDISFIKGLTNLRELDLSYNQISDLTPLANLTQLTELCLSNNQISDLTPLAHLTKLDNLFVGDNQIVDLKPLANLTRLNSLAISNNKIIDYSIVYDLWKKNPSLYVDYLGNPEAGFEYIFSKVQLADLELLVNQTCKMKEIQPIFGRGFVGECTYEVVDKKVADFDKETNEIRTKNPGITEVIVKYGNVEKKYKLTVDDLDISEENKLPPEKFGQFGNKSVLVNGQIWNFEYGEVKVSGDKEIKSYGSYSVARKKNEQENRWEYFLEYYAIDKDNTLWNFTKKYYDDKEYQARKVRENVSILVEGSKTEFYYLTQSGECYKISSNGTVESQYEEKLMVKNAETVDKNGMVTLKDGTKAYITFYDEVETFNFPIEKLSSRVQSKDFSNTVYQFALDKNGNLWRREELRDDPVYSWGEWETKPVKTGVEDICEIGYVINGITYNFLDDKEFANVPIKKYYFESNYYIDLPPRYVTQNNDFYIGERYENNFVKVLENVKEVINNFVLDNQNNLYYIKSNSQKPVLVLTSVIAIAKEDAMKTPYIGIYIQREDGSIWYGNSTSKNIVEKLTHIDNLSDFSNKTMVDETGVTVSGLIEKGVELAVDPVTDEASKTALKEKVEKIISENNEVNAIHVFDISFMKDGKEIQPKAPVTVSLPIPEGFGKNLAVYHEKADRSLELIQSTVNENKVIFTATSFSSYILADLKVVEKPEPTPEENKVVKSGLEIAISEAEQVQKGNYTEESWKAFQEALKEAKIVMADENATQEEVNAQIKALEAARKALKEEQKKDPVKDPKPEDKPVNGKPVKNDKPKTGDETQIFGYVAAMALALGAGVVVLKKGKKIKKK